MGSIPGRDKRFFLFSKTSSEPVTLLVSEYFHPWELSGRGWNLSTQLHLAHGCPAFLWQRATPINVGWCEGLTWKNNKVVYIIAKVIV
jgi:hypothetical protein